MIDAYTIGITLALNNGVAEGIAAIRQDLAALDRAVDASAAGLMQLRAAAGGSIGAASADLARLMDTARRAAAAMPKPSLGRHPEEPPLGSPPNEKKPEAQEFQPRSQQPLAPASPGESRLPAVPKVVLPGPAPTNAALRQSASPASPRAEPPSRSPLAAVQKENASRPITLPIPASPRAASDPRSASLPRLLPEPATPLWREKRTQPPIAPTAAAPAIDYAALARAMSPPRLGDAARPLATRHVEHTHAETRTIIRERETAPSPIVAPPALVAPAPAPVPSGPTATAPSAYKALAAPRVSERPPPAAPVVVPGSRPRASQDGPRSVMLPKAVSSGLPSAARQRPSTAPASTIVEVVLDGAAIGRWMDQRLARAATRPPSGLTGFDPRLSPIWPTAPVPN